MASWYVKLTKFVRTFWYVLDANWGRFECYHGLLRSNVPLGKFVLKSGILRAILAHPFPTSGSEKRQIWNNLVGVPYVAFEPAKDSSGGGGGGGGPKCPGKCSKCAKTYLFLETAGNPNVVAETSRLLLERARASPAGLDRETRQDVGNRRRRPHSLKRRAKGGGWGGGPPRAIVGLRRRGGVTFVLGGPVLFCFWSSPGPVERG